MPFEQAVQIVEKSLFDPGSLTEIELLSISFAQAMLAAEYVKIKHRIMPA